MQANIQKFLLKTGGTTGTFRISSLKAGHLADHFAAATRGLHGVGVAQPMVGRFVATVRVTAGSSPVAGWTVTMTLPAGATITNAWNVNRSANTGTVQFTNAGFNGSIAAGQSTEFGFQATGTGTGMTPSCTAR